MNRKDIFAEIKYFKAIIFNTIYYQVNKLRKSIAACAVLQCQ